MSAFAHVLRVEGGTDAERDTRTNQNGVGERGNATVIDLSLNKSETSPVSESPATPRALGNSVPEKKIKSEKKRLRSKQTE